MERTSEFTELRLATKDDRDTQSQQLINTFPLLTPAGQLLALRYLVNRAFEAGYLKATIEGVK